MSVQVSTYNKLLYFMKAPFTDKPKSDLPFDFVTGLNKLK
jgi:hypothetical protein